MLTLPPAGQSQMGYISFVYSLVTFFLQSDFCLISLVVLFLRLLLFNQAITQIVFKKLNDANTMTMGINYVTENGPAIKCLV